MRRKNDENVLINEEKIYRENKESKQTIKCLKIKRERFNYVLSSGFSLRVTSNYVVSIRTPH